MFPKEINRTRILVRKYGLITTVNTKIDGSKEETQKKEQEYEMLLCKYDYRYHY